ncbi:Ser/Thr protein phosphatase superfamily protein [Collybia nuda]|uniref:Ser/Thr protein phosphatase superfamily protein n=1 Tax=Collybia nuda TaxID=64659 RepID=A0A9P5YF75_9AGAR|nr:Ser/Thr protein phosphatase superfamily protein [Collybia nuda]
MTTDPQVRVQFLSDLHLEIERDPALLYSYDSKPSAPTLALLGDIGWTRNDRLFEWLKSQLTRFQRVLYVLGNHEPYGSTLAQSCTKIEAFALHNPGSSVGEFIFLKRKRYDLTPTVTVLGCMPVLITSQHTTYMSLHQEDVDWLAASIRDIRVNEAERRVVVLSHHALTIKGIGDPKYIGGPTNSAFATELTGQLWWGPPMIVWAFGHTHWNCDFERNGVRVVSNQRGYGDGGTGFSESKVLEF